MSENPTIEEIMKGIHKDLVTLETKRDSLSMDDLIECLANISANQMMIFAIFKHNLNIDKPSEDCSGLYA